MDFQSPFLWVMIAFILAARVFAYVMTRGRRTRTRAERAATERRWGQEETKL